MSVGSEKTQVFDTHKYLGFENQEYGLTLLFCNSQYNEMNSLIAEINVQLSN